MKIRSLAIAACLTFATAACTGEVTAPEESAPQGLDLARLSGDDIAGTFATADRVVSFRSTETQEGFVSVSFQIDDRSLVFDLDYGAGSGDFQADLASLDDADLHAMIGLARELELAFPGDHTTRTLAAQALAQQAGFVSMAPVDEPLVSFEILAERSITCISCACQTQYIGNGYYRQAGKGSWCTGGSGNGCKGRCGSGCGTNGGGYYTRDCALHDYGLGSWTAAADDWSFGWNCSC